MLRTYPFLKGSFKSKICKSVNQKTIFTASDNAVQLENLVNDNLDSHFFLDEVAVGLAGLKTSFLNDLADRIPKQKYLWIACQSHLPPREKHLKSK